MENLIPEAWDTNAIESHNLARDIAQHLFPQYVQKVVNLAFPKYLIP